MLLLVIVRQQQATPHSKGAAVCSRQSPSQPMTMFGTRSQTLGQLLPQRTSKPRQHNSNLASPRSTNITWLVVRGCVQLLPFNQGCPCRAAILLCISKLRLHHWAVTCCLKNCLSSLQRSGCLLLLLPPPRWRPCPAASGAIISNIIIFVIIGAGARVVGVRP